MWGPFVKLFVVCISCLLYLAPTALAQTSRSVTVYSTRYCATQYGPSKQSRPLSRTTYKTVTHSHTTLTSTTTPTVTVTPTASTTTPVTTDTATATVTLSTTTDTATSTSTVVTTETDTSTSTVVATTTVTTVVTTNEAPTTTIAAPADFTPVAVEYPPSKKARSAVKERGVESNSGSHANKLLGPFAMSYPTRVFCSKTVTSMTFTFITTAGSATTTTLPPGTITAPASTTTVTTTSTSIPADTTTTVTVTSTSTTTSDTSTTVVGSTSSITSTSTSYIPQATVYAVCQTDQNYLNTYQGNLIRYVQYNISYTENDQSSAQDCCNICQAMGDCAGSALIVGTPYCFLLGDGGQCSASTEGGFFTTSTDTAINFNISNGACGRYIPD